MKINQLQMKQITLNTVIVTITIMPLVYLELELLADPQRKQPATIQYTCKTHRYMHMHMHTHNAK